MRISEEQLQRMKDMAKQIIEKNLSHDNAIASLLNTINEKLKEDSDLKVLSLRRQRRKLRNLAARGK